MRPPQQETEDLFTFTKEILDGKLHFLWSDKEVVDIWNVTMPKSLCIQVFKAPWLFHIVWRPLRGTRGRSWRFRGQNAAKPDENDFSTAPNVFYV